MMGMIGDVCGEVPLKDLASKAATKAKTSAVSFGGLRRSFGKGVSGVPGGEDFLSHIKSHLERVSTNSWEAKGFLSYG